MIEYVDLREWKKQQDIILELHRENGINITPREWRNQVEKWNRKFAEGDVDYYITHSNIKGFKATRDYEEAKVARNDYIKRAINMLNKAKACDKAFGVIDNYKFDYKTGEIK